MIWRTTMSVMKPKQRMSLYIAPSSLYSSSDGINWNQVKKQLGLGFWWKIWACHWKCCQDGLSIPHFQVSERYEYQSVPVWTWPEVEPQWWFLALLRQGLSCMCRTPRASLETIALNAAQIRRWLRINFGELLYRSCVYRCWKSDTGEGDYKPTIKTTHSYSRQRESRWHTTVYFRTNPPV